MLENFEPGPAPFIEVICKEPWGLDIGFEDGEWRHTQFAEHLMEWLPEFSLSYTERNNIGSQNAVRQVKKAARSIYNSEKYQKRGEFGELILHAILRQEFNTLPAISKIYFKDSPNDTVKGFDCVHVVAAEEGLQLWIGEIKFYKSISQAITDVIEELKTHTQTDYLRQEFSVIENKIDPNWPYAEALKAMTRQNTSMDTIIKRLCIPVLLTYNSSQFVHHTEACQELTTALIEEVNRQYQNFDYKFKEAITKPITVHLILFPLKCKDTLITAMNEELVKLQ